MIVIAAVLLGAVIGWRRATALKGDNRDKLQYAAAHALAFAALGLFITIFIDRMM